MDHQAVVNSECSRLSIATFQNPAPEAPVYPLKIREGEKPVVEEPITFSEMYKRKMNNDLELARLKKLANEKNLQEEKLQKSKVEVKVKSCKGFQGVSSLTDHDRKTIN